MSDPYASNLSAAVDVRMKFFPLAFLLLLFKPQLQVDGAPPVAMSWGTARVPLAPGRHQLRAYVPYLFFRTMGDASCVIDIAAGQTMQATWSAPWLAFLPGKWRLEGVQAGAAPIAGAVAAALRLEKLGRAQSFDGVAGAVADLEAHLNQLRTEIAAL